MTANKRIFLLSRDNLANAAITATSTAHLVRNLGFVASANNCAAVRQRIKAFGLPRPALPARQGKWSDTEAVRDAVRNSNSYSDVLRRLGLNTEAGNIRTLKRHIKRLELGSSHLTEGKRLAAARLASFGRSLKRPLEEVLVENSTYDRRQLKKRLVEEGLLEYRCRGCGNCGEWNGEPLVLELEHKNGISDDNRLFNLEFLCPNCHSQTNTYSGRNNKGNTSALNLVHRPSVQVPRKSKISWPEIDALRTLVETTPNIRSSKATWRVGHRCTQTLFAVGYCRQTTGLLAEGRSGND